MPRYWKPGERILRLLNKQIFDLAFIDLNLDANLDGLDVVKASAEKNVYTVVLSGYDDDDVIEKAYQYGCQDFFEKGNEQESIENVILDGELEGTTSGNPLEIHIDTTQP